MAARVLEYIPLESSNEISECRKEITILLVGETGFGKSTFINAFVNYLAHDKLGDASKNIVCLIPSYFSIWDSETYTMKKVTLGIIDENENDKTGQSATQYCKCYVFPLGEITLRLIDTPGIGDTRGVKTDGTNMRNLLSFIAQNKEINAICVLLKPNEARVGVIFKYCILELLTHLNKSAKDNIIFLFTNSRGTFYKPGDSAASLLEILKAVKESPPNVEIKFTDNVFCLDNEAFRYLVAISEPNKVEFNEKTKKEFKSSWKKSVNECEQMISYILSLPPHKVQDTLSVNNARETILLLTQPLVDIAKNIADNVIACEAQERKLFEWNGNISDLQKELFTPFVDIISTPLKHPKTVCGDSNCCDKTNVNNTVKIYYKTTCHNPCYLDNSDGNIIGNKGLLDCQAFNKYEFTEESKWCKVSEFTCYPDQNVTPNKNGEIWAAPSKRIKSDFCFICKHSYQSHLHIDYETRFEQKEIRDENKYKQITNAKEAAAAQHDKIQELTSRIAQLSNERDEITKCTAIFACFLKNIALTPFNDAFEEYLLYLINKEKRVILPSSDNRQTIDSLNRMLSAYKEEKIILENAINNGVSNVAFDISSRNIEVYIDLLCKLQLNGPTIKKHLEMQKQSQKAAHSHSREIRYNVKTIKNSWWNKIKLF